MKTLKNLYLWATISMIRFLKRRIFLFLCIGGIILLSFRWGLLCTSVEPHLHVQHICDSYANSLSVGNLCRELCPTHRKPTFSCHKFYKEKSAVFSGILMNKSVVFKSSKKRRYDYSPEKILKKSEYDFSQKIKTLIKIRFNITLNDKDAQKFSYSQYRTRGNRHTEMSNIWSLLQDNEYVALNLYEQFDIFPKLIGTCGSIYGVQKLSTIAGYWQLMSLYDSQEEWHRRIKAAIMIMDYLLKLENGLPEPLLLCDVKLSHFGITDDNKKVKYLDLDAVHPHSVVSKVIRNSQCKQHSDCDFNDCRSFCNFMTYTCQFGVVNNNLQRICEKVFLGWMLSGRLMLPGLLVGSLTPKVLLEVLEACANPAREMGVPRAATGIEIRKRLYDLLTHMIPTDKY